MVSYFQLTKEREKPKADRAAPDVEFRSYRRSSKGQITRVQRFLDGYTRRANRATKEREILLVSQKSLKAKWRHIPDDNENLDDIQYELDDAVCEELHAQGTVTSLQSELSYVQSVIESYCQRLLEYTEHVTAEITDNFSVFLYDLL